MLNVLNQSYQTTSWSFYAGCRDSGDADIIPDIDQPFGPSLCALKPNQFYHDPMISSRHNPSGTKIRRWTWGAAAPCSESFRVSTTHKMRLHVMIVQSGVYRYTAIRQDKTTQKNDLFGTFRKMAWLTSFCQQDRIPQDLELIEIVSWFQAK
jgi:hypothetical protein